MQSQNKNNDVESGYSPLRRTIGNWVWALLRLLCKIIPCLSSLACIKKIREEQERRAEQVEQIQPLSEPENYEHTESAESVEPKMPDIPEGCMLMTEQQMKAIHQTVEDIKRNAHFKIRFRHSFGYSDVQRKPVLMVLEQILKNARRTSAHKGFSYIIPDITPILSKYPELLPEYQVKWFNDKKRNSVTVFPGALTTEFYHATSELERDITPGEERNIREDLRQIEQLFETHTRGMNGITTYNYCKEHTKDLKPYTVSVNTLSTNVRISKLLHETKKTQVDFSCNPGHHFRVPVTEFEKLLHQVHIIHYSLFVRNIIDQNLKLHKKIINNSTQENALLCLSSADLPLPLSLYDKLYEKLGYDNPILPLMTALLEPQPPSKILIKVKFCDDQVTQDYSQDIETAIQILQNHCPLPAHTYIEINESQLQNFMKLREEICKNQHHNDIVLQSVIKNPDPKYTKDHPWVPSATCRSDNILSFLDMICDNARHTTQEPNKIKVPDVFSALLKNHELYYSNPIPAAGLIIMAQSVWCKQEPMQCRATLTGNRATSNPRELKQDYKDTLERCKQNFQDALTKDDVPYDLSKHRIQFPVIGEVGKINIEMLRNMQEKLKTVKQSYVKFTWDYHDQYKPAPYETKGKKYKFYEPVTLQTQQLRDVIDQVLKNTAEPEILISYSRLYEICGKDKILLSVLNRLIHISPSEDSNISLTPLEYPPQTKELTEEEPIEEPRREDVPDVSVTITQPILPNIIVEAAI